MTVFLVIMAIFFAAAFFSMSADSSRRKSEEEQKKKVLAQREKFEQQASDAIEKLSLHIAMRLNDSESSMELKMQTLRDHFSFEQILVGLKLVSLEVAMLGELTRSPDWIVLRNLRCRLSDSELAENGILVFEGNELLASPPHQSESMGGFSSDEILRFQRSPQMVSALASRNLLEIGKTSSIADGSCSVEARISTEGWAISKFLNDYGTGNVADKDILYFGDEWNRNLAENFSNHRNFMDIVRYPVISDLKKAPYVLAKEIHCALLQFACTYQGVHQ